MTWSREHAAGQLLGHDLWLGLGPYGLVAAWGGQRAAAGTLNREDESIAESLAGVILFAVTEFLGTGSQVPLLLVIDTI
jgi:hypothetical protein